MYRVKQGQKIRNIKTGDLIKNYYAGETLPEGYEPPVDYISNKIIEIIETEKKKGVK